MRYLTLLLIVCTSCLLHGQYAIGTGRVAELYTKHCAVCHGAELDGGLGGSLLVGEWKYIGEELSFIDYVAKGNEEMGMPAFSDLLDRRELRSLEIFIQEMQQKASRGDTPERAPDDFIFEAGSERFTLETVVDGLKDPWALSFFEDGRGIFTIETGELHILEKDGSTTEITGLPTDIWMHGQGGLLEVAPHPNYADNGWIYLGYSSSGGEQDGKKRGITKVVRGKIKGGRWREQETIFEAPSEFHSPSGVHFGTRFVFQDGYLFFGIGDRGSQDQAQDLTRPNGKIHRIHDDGRIPNDNPFINQVGAYPTIWTYGNRNPQGLDLHPLTGALWESEHGPRGGDEINLIERGKNYGWPVITYGMNYKGTPITDRTEAEGMEQPKLYWTPSIAVCGMDFYEGDRFPTWHHNLIVGGLVTEQLHRLVIEDGRVIHDEIILKGQGRVRDVANGPDGFIYVVITGNDSRIARLVPAG
jgi:glucose/arabinose dehydrogenase